MLTVSLSWTLRGLDYDIGMSQEAEHNLVRVSVGHPRLCAVCEDYIVTPRCTARKCLTCGRLYHAPCVTKAGKCENSRETLSSEAEDSVAVSLADQVS